MIDTIDIRLSAPLLPEGIEINTEINSRDIEGGLSQLKRAIRFAFDESDIARVATPGERTLTARFDAIEKSIIAGLPAEVRLDIANQAAAR